MCYHFSTKLTVQIIEFLRHLFRLGLISEWTCFTTTSPAPVRPSCSWLSQLHILLEVSADFIFLFLSHIPFALFALTHSASLCLYLVF